MGADVSAWQLILCLVFVGGGGGGRDLGVSVVKTRVWGLMLQKAQLFTISAPQCGSGPSLPLLWFLYAVNLLFYHIILSIPQASTTELLVAVRWSFEHQVYIPNELKRIKPMNILRIWTWPIISLPQNTECYVQRVFRIYNNFLYNFFRQKT